MKTLKSKFQKRIFLHFQVTNFFMHLYHFISFIQLTWNEEKGMKFSHFISPSATGGHHIVETHSWI